MTNYEELGVVGDYIAGVYDETQDCHHTPVDRIALLEGLFQRLHGFGIVVGAAEPVDMLVALGGEIRGYEGNDPLAFLTAVLSALADTGHMSGYESFRDAVA